MKSISTIHPAITENTENNLCSLSRHTVVCRAPQETRGTWQQVCILQEQRKCRFHASVAQHSLNRNTRNFLCKFPRGVGPRIPNLSWIHQAFPKICTFKSKFVLFSSYFSSPSSSFRNTFWNHYNSRVLGWIALKFGALLEHIYNSIFVAMG